MNLIEILQEHKHTDRRTWMPGDRPVVSDDLCVQLIIAGKAKFIAKGCGCINQQ